MYMVPYISKLSIAIALLLAMCTHAYPQALDRTHIGYVNPLEYGSVCNSTTLNGTITEIGTTKKTLIIPQTDRLRVLCTWTLTTDVTTNVNTEVYIPMGTVIVAGVGITVTFNGIVVVEDPVGSLTGAGTYVFNKKLWGQSQAYEDVLSNFVKSGGLYGTSVNLTSPTFATRAWLNGVEIHQGATAIAYPAQANDVCWTIISSDNDGILNWTRVGTTAYYYRCEGDTTPNQPILPEHSSWLSQITVTTSAIAAVKDMRVRSSTQGIHVSTFSALQTVLIDYSASLSEVTVHIAQPINVTNSITVTKNVYLSFANNTYLLNENTIIITLRTCPIAGQHKIFDTAQQDSTTEGIAWQATCRPNVKWFGASGQDDVDDKPAFQAALDAVKLGLNPLNTHRPLYVPCGRYRLYSSIVSENISHTGLYGDGSCSVLISRLTAANPMVHFTRNPLTSATRAIAIKDIRLTGEWVDGTESNGGSSESALLQLTQCLNCIVENVTVTDGVAKGIWLYQAEGVHFSHIRVQRNGTIGIDFTDAGSINRITQCFIKNNGTVGIKFVGGATSTVTNCTFETHTGTPGIAIWDTTTRTSITGNSFELNNTDIMLGDIAGARTSNDVWISHNEFFNGNSGAHIKAEMYAQPRILYNRFDTSVAPISWGVNDSSKGALYIGNAGPLSSIVLSGTDGKIIHAQNFLTGTTILNTYSLVTDTDTDCSGTFADGFCKPKTFGYTTGHTNFTVGTGDATCTGASGAAKVCISDIFGGYPGATFTLRVTDAITQIVNGSQIVTDTAANVNPASGDILVFQATLPSGAGATSRPRWALVRHISP